MVIGSNPTIPDRTVDLVVPDADDQERVMDALYGVKAGEHERPRTGSRQHRAD